MPQRPPHKMNTSGIRSELKRARAHLRYAEKKYADSDFRQERERIAALEKELNARGATDAKK